MPLPGERGVQGDESEGSNRDRPGSRGAYIQFIPLVDETMPAGIFFAFSASSSSGKSCYSSFWL